MAKTLGALTCRWAYAYSCFEIFGSTDENRFFVILNAEDARALAEDILATLKEVDTSPNGYYPYHNYYPIIKIEKHNDNTRPERGTGGEHPKTRSDLVNRLLSEFNEDK